MMSLRKLSSASLLSIAISVFIEVSSVSAHGFVREVVIGSETWPGYNPFVDSWWEPPPQRIIRKIPGIAPIEDLTLIDLQCNGDTATDYFTEPAPLAGTVAAGDTVQLNWLNHAGDNHKGPLVTYMAKAPSDIDVREWSPGTEAVWFKVHHDGKTKDGKWAAREMFEQLNGTYTFRIPPKLLPGQYLIRHEWIALHFADKYPGFQSYPVCIQVEVTGNGTAFPTSFVSFPGEYTPETPGVIYDVWNDDVSQPYPIPGPEVWTGGN